MNHSNILCDEMDSLYGWSACTTGISGWVRCIPYISKPQLIRDKGGMLRHAPALPHVTIKPQEISDGQGFQQPRGYTGTGTEGKGQGTDLKTLEKPIPLSRVRGYPWYMLRVFVLSSVNFIQTYED